VEPQTVEVTRVVQGTPVVEKVEVTATPAPTQEQPPFKVAVVLPSTVKDVEWSQSLYEGLLALQKDMGGEAKFQIALSEDAWSVPDAAAAIRDYASQGFDLVIAHGAQYGTSLQQIAPDFPETSFAWGTTTNTFQADGIDNIFAYQPEAQQSGYVNGVMAAMMTKTGVLGVTGPIEAGDAKLYNEGFKAGAEATKPDVKVNVSYTGSFSDITLMSASAETQIKNGADILTGTSQSVVGAISVCKEKNAYWFASAWYQTDLAPDNVVATVIYNWKGLLKDMVDSHNAGVMGGKAYFLTFKNGGLQLVYNDKVQIPDDVKAAAEATIKGIEDGSVKINVSE
jgi:basic membrane protein A